MMVEKMQVILYARKWGGALFLTASVIQRLDDSLNRWYMKNPCYSKNSYYSNAFSTKVHPSKHYFNGCNINFIFQKHIIMPCL